MYLYRYIIDSFILVLEKHTYQNIQFTDNIYIYTMTMHPAPRMT